LLGILVIIPVLVGIAITMKIKTKNITKQTLPTKKMKRKNSTSIVYSLEQIEVGESNEAKIIKREENQNILQNNINLDITEIKAETITTSKRQETVTLQNTTHEGIYIPGYKEFRIGFDFNLKTKLAEGGFGAVFLGELINNDLKNQYNNGQIECVIKIATKSCISPLFLQELSIHEVFRKEKYFSQLICYSEEPQTFVLKFYRYGTLASFVFPSKTKPSLASNFEYSLKNVFYIGEKLAFGYNQMHKKRIIHNDIKPDNILLHGDEEEPLYPVITDFGICKIMDSAEVVNGFETLEIRAFTAIYSAPEVLYSIANKDKKRKSNYKTDVYSLGVILGELFTRKRMWKKFDAAYIISGGNSDINAESILAQWKDMSEEMAVNLLCLVMDCIEYDCTKRPSMGEINHQLTRLSLLL
jgi:serine/threonine protein kinase